MVQCNVNRELNDHPFWRTNEQKENTPTIAEMLEQIVNFKKSWDNFKEKVKDEKRSYVEDQLKKIDIDFFVSIQVEEGIGMSTIEDSNEIEENKTKVKEDTERVLENFNINKKQAMRTPSFEKSMSTEQVLEKFNKHKNNKDSKPSPKNEQELLNLYKGHKYLKQLAESETNEPEKYSQLLELDIIKQTHITLMTNLLEGKTKPGKFSTCGREGSFRGQCFKYPEFKNEEIASDVLTALIDNYNSSVENIKKELGNGFNKNVLRRVFQSAAKFLFIFLQLHPFSDGNGRLGRLLCSYFLELICPFPSPIYNVYSPTEKSHYVKVLTDARGEIDFERTLNQKQEGIDFFGKLLDHDESNLTSLIIESNWCSWKKFLDVIERKFPDELASCKVM